MKEIFQPLFSLSHVDYAYPENSGKVISNLSLKIPRSSITAILGMNGSGKSTLLRLLLGTLVPQNGSIQFEGEKVFEDKNNGKIAFLPQIEYLAFDYSVMEYILFGRIPHVNTFGIPNSMDVEKVKNVIDELNLHNLRNKKITHLSGGELQKVRLARALAQEPIVLLLDEPTTYLDLHSKKNILDLLTNLKSKGVTIILASHDPSEASEIADYFVLMRTGKPAVCGFQNEIFTEEKLSQTYFMDLNIITVSNKKIVVHG